MYFVPLFDPCKRFKCLSCGRCCGKGLKKWFLELTVRDLKMLNELGYSNAVRRLNGRYFLKRKEDGSCFFLDKDNLCILRKEYEWYPLGCRLFPFAYYIINSTLFITVNEEYIKRIKCPGYGKGDTLGSLVDYVLEQLYKEGIIEEYYVKNTS